LPSRPKNNEIETIYRESSNSTLQTLLTAQRSKLARASNGDQDERAALVAARPAETNCSKPTDCKQPPTTNKSGLLAKLDTNDSTTANKTLNA